MKEMLLTRLSGFFFLAGFVMLTGCGNNNGSQQNRDTPTSGHTRMEADDSYKLLVDAELYPFQAMYAEAKIDVTCKNEADVLNDFMKDSVRCIIVNRPLTKENEQFLQTQQVVARTNTIAYDAVALIVNRQNPDSNFFYDRIQDIFTGKITTWKQLNPKSKLGNIAVVFDNYKSSNPRYFKEKFSLEKLPQACYAVNNNEEVINFVESHKEAMGIISVNWISDKADSISQLFLHRISVAGISPPGTVDPNTSFYQPYQAYIKQGTYPFTREVYCINRESYPGLGYGFTSFIAGPQGQLIVEHSGLLPATMPVRIVEIKH